MKIIFMGTPDFAVPCLEKLIKSEHEIVGVFTQPDKKKGRTQVLSKPPVKELAEKFNLKVFQPETLKDIQVTKLIKDLNAELIVVVAYGKILPKDILNIPTYGCVNVHGSLLPKLRGAAPIQWALINGEKITGVTTMFMDVGLDTGDIILKMQTKIEKDETSKELFDRLKYMGADLLMQTIKLIENGSVSAEKQDDSMATYAPMLSKDMSVINWNNNAVTVHNFIRGLNPWPVARTVLGKKSLKIYNTTVVSSIKGQPGEIISVNPFVVCCADGSAVRILELQLESKKRMDAESFVRGYKLNLGDFLG